ATGSRRPAARCLRRPSTSRRPSPRGRTPRSSGEQQSNRAAPSPSARPNRRSHVHTRGDLQAARLQPSDGWGGSTTGEDLGFGVGGFLALGSPVWSWRRLALNLQLTTGAGLFPDDAASQAGGFALVGLELALQ